MRIKPIQPDTLGPELRQVHDEILNLVTRSQGQVNMLDTHGALMGPFVPMLTYPQFGIPALTFLRSVDQHAKLDKKVREVAILTVGGVFGARFLLYAHEIMANTFGLSQCAIAALAAGSRPADLNEPENIAYDLSRSLVSGHIVPDSTFKQAVHLLGPDGAAELIFLIGGYCLIATVLNGFDMPSPEFDS